MVDCFLDYSRGVGSALHGRVCFTRVCWTCSSEFVGLILATDSCEKSQSTLCRKSWVFSGRSGFLPQRKLTGWVRINTVKKLISQWTIPQLTKILNSTSLDKNFITARKSITKLVIFQSFVAKCCKMRII